MSLPGYQGNSQQLNAERAVHEQVSLEHLSSMSTAKLHSWFTSNGGMLHPAIEIAHSEVDGYHLRTIRDLDHSIPVIHCPANVTLSASDLLTDLLWPAAFRAKYERASPEVLLRFLLVHEYLQEKASKWWPYISTLPQPPQCTKSSSLNTPVWYSVDDREWLKDTNIAAAIEDRERQWQDEHQEGISLLRATVDVASYDW